MTARREPTIFLLVRVALIINIACAIFFIVILMGGIMFDSISSSFSRSMVVLDVQKAVAGVDTARLVIPVSAAYEFQQSRTGDLAVMMPWYSHFFIPLGFVNIPGFEFSISYWVFYCVLCFLFYRIISSISIKTPFSDHNISRIFWIGYTLILYDLFVVIRYIILSLFVEEITHDAFRYDGLGPLLYFKIGILIIIIAMIYKKGVAMQREQELTI